VKLGIILHNIKLYFFIFPFYSPRCQLKQTVWCASVQWYLTVMACATTLWTLTLTSQSLLSTAARTLTQHIWPKVLRTLW